MQEITNNVPYIAYESALDRSDRTIRRLWILCIVLAVLLVATNVAWFLYERQFETVETTTIEQEVEIGDGDGDTIVNGIGDVNYGEGKTKGNGN